MTFCFFFSLFFEFVRLCGVDWGQYSELSWRFCEEFRSLHSVEVLRDLIISGRDFFGDFVSVK